MDHAYIRCLEKTEAVVPAGILSHNLELSFGTAC